MHGEKLGELYAHYASAGGYDARSRAGRLLHGLGFSSADETRAVREFSGGWRVRLNVAQALMCRSDLLLLDEPTNHLDLDAILWLETWLQGISGHAAAHRARPRVPRSRDRSRRQHRAWQGTRVSRQLFGSSRISAPSELAEQAALFTRQQREIKHMESFVERFRAKASKARQAQSRLKALERMQRIAPAHVDSPFEFSFAAPDKLPRPLLALEKQSAGYDGRVVLRTDHADSRPGRSHRPARSQRRGQIHVHEAAGGRARRRWRARAPKRATCASATSRSISSSSSRRRIRRSTNLRRFGAARAAQRHRAGTARLPCRVSASAATACSSRSRPFSGGEKARLVLALVAYLRPNLMLLDEPTNHLDLEMRQALTVALQEYDGAVVLVSHDRHLLRTVADEFYVVHGGRAAPFDGDLEDYAKWLAETDSANPSALAPSAAPGTRRASRGTQARDRNRRVPQATQARRSRAAQSPHARCGRR